MTAHYIAHDAKGYVAFRLVNGLYRLNVGPHFPTPKEAMAYADSLDSASEVSPLRTSPSEPPIAGSIPPGGLRVGSGGSLGAREPSAASPLRSGAIATAAPSRSSNRKGLTVPGRR